MQALNYVYNRAAANLRGADVGLITTEGFRDILHIARHKKPLNFSNYQDLPWQAYPVVRRRYRLTVPERVRTVGSTDPDVRHMPSSPPLQHS